MKKIQLVRRYVGRSLAEYYAQPAQSVVGKSDGVDKSNLSSLLGQWHWLRVFKKLYDEREGHWLTPVELFRPHYSRIVADYCATTTFSGVSGEVEIFEVGGGRGTNASLILSYLEETHPDLYENLTYTLVDASPSLHKHQKDTLGSGPHGDKFRFELKDLTDVAEKKVELFPKSEIPTVVLGMEVLDNLPHDKVRAKSRKKIEEAGIIKPKNGAKEEVFKPLTDPLISKVIKTVPSYATTYPSWIPTVACGVFGHAIQQRPNLGLLFADFDWLPPPDLQPDSDDSIRLTTYAEGEPIVTDMDGVDHECYLDAPKHCDILFPTDFHKLASFVDRTLGKDSNLSVEVLKQADFLEIYGYDHVERTKSWLSGHTPLLHDFGNCSVLAMGPKNVSV